MFARRPRFYYLMLVGLLLWACHSYDSSSISDERKKEIKSIGHGGMGFPSLFPFNPIPTNSMRAFQEAIVHGESDGIEMDVHMTKDFDFVLYHDKTLESKTAMSGYPSDFLLKELEGSSYQLGFPYDFFQEESVIGLKVAMAFFQSLPEFPMLHLDLRTYSENKSPEENQAWKFRMAKELIAVLDSYRLDSNRIYLICIEKELSLFLREIGSYKVSTELQDPMNDLEWVLGNGIQSVIIHSKKASAEFTRVAHQNGVEVTVFGAKSKSGNEKILSTNPDHIQSDDLKSLHQLLNR